MTRGGLFVTLDGPGGVGKTTVAALVGQALVRAGLPVHPTTEPSRTALGELIRASTDTYRGLALAYLVAGDRHHHLTCEIRPQRAAGSVVICDRYIPSSLVLQRMDGLDWETVWLLNADLDRPDLAVILNAQPQVIQDRMIGRGAPHSRFERQPGSSRTESDLYHDTAHRLRRLGWPIHAIDCTTRGTADITAILTDPILSLYAKRSAHGNRPPIAADVQHR